MSWRDYIARTAVRRVVWVLVGLAVYAVIGWFSPAHAQACPAPMATLPSRAGSYPTQPEAFAACKADAAGVEGKVFTGLIRRDVQCFVTGKNYRLDGATYNNSGACASTGNRNQIGSYNYSFLAGCPAENPWDPVSGTCSNPCAVRSPLGATPLSNVSNPAGAATVCSESCTFENDGVLIAVTIDGTLYHASSGGWAATGGQCTNTPENTPASGPVDTDGDGTSDGNDGSPNNPGADGGGGPDGASQPQDGDCGGPGQPQCGDPASGSGNGNTSGGGGTCASPPSSTGDPILAQIAYQSWATRCAVERQGAGQGTNPGTGQGDAETKGILQSIKDWLTGDGSSLNAELPAEDDAQQAWAPAGDGVALDTSGLGTGTCPAPPEIFGVSIDAAGNMCMFARLIGALVLFGAFAQAAYIIGRA